MMNFTDPAAATNQNTFHMSLPGQQVLSASNTNSVQPFHNLLQLSNSSGRYSQNGGQPTQSDSNQVGLNVSDVMHENVPSVLPEEDELTVVDQVSLAVPETQIPTQIETPQLYATVQTYESVSTLEEQLVKIKEDVASVQSELNTTLEHIKQSALDGNTVRLAELGPRSNAISQKLKILHDERASIEEKILDEPRKKLEEIRQQERAVEQEISLLNEKLHSLQQSLKETSERKNKAEAAYESIAEKNGIVL